MSFNKENYSKLIENIEKSKGYLSYIDSFKKKGFTNKRYQRYLEYKTALYNVYPPYALGTDKLILSYIEDQTISREKIDELYEEYGVNDDYELEYEEQSLSNGQKTIKYYTIPTECRIFDNALELDEHFEVINREYLSDDFFMRSHRRFTLLPFECVFEGEYLEPYVIANVYDVGILTIQLILYTKHKGIINIPDLPPNDIKFEKVGFIKNQKEYKFNDYWKKDYQESISAYEILDYYEKQLNFLNEGMLKLNKNHNNNHISWCFGDYEINKRNDHNDFIKSNQKLILSYLTNARKENVTRVSNRVVGERLESYEIVKNSEMSYYCSPVASLVTFGYSAIWNQIKEDIGQNEKQLKEDGAYEDILEGMFKKLTLSGMLEFIRFYELTIIKKYYLNRLLNDMSLNTYKTLSSFNSIRRELNIIKLKFDDEILFSGEGSPKEIYKDILMKTNVYRLLEKAELMVKNIREDVNSHRELEIKYNETLILIITSLLAITLGYNGIKLIVYDVLVHLPLVGGIIENHPLRTTLLFWISLVCIMLYLNITRWQLNRK